MLTPMSEICNVNRTIPQSRQQLIELCLAEGRLTPEEAERFRSFCELLAAYTHFQFHQVNETLKKNYLPFNPDLEETLRRSNGAVEPQAMEAQLITTLSETLERANYAPLDWVAIMQAIKRSDLVDLKTEIDFYDFEQILLYHRGLEAGKGARKKLLWKQQIDMQIYSNVLLGLKFKNESYFGEKGAKLRKLNFRPGCIYFYLYRNIPQYDLELLFPNVRLSMNWFDRVLFLAPALGAGISVLIKIVPNLLLLLGVITFLVFGPSFSERLGVKEQQIHDASPVMFALTSVMLALGGFAYRQYDSYKNKRILFMKNVTETLFFRSIANNASAFHHLIDAAEEEESKELLLAYYHLLINNGVMTWEQIERRIEKWLSDRCGTTLAFNGAKTLARLQSLSAEITPPGAKQTHLVSLLTEETNGLCRVPSLTEAKMVLDKLWDSAYDVQ